MKSYFGGTKGIFAPPSHPVLHDRGPCVCRSPQSPGVLAALDATVHKAVGDRFKISGFPTLKYFEKGEEKYTLPQLRNKDKIIEFMHKWVTTLRWFLLLLVKKQKIFQMQQVWRVVSARKVLLLWEFLFFLFP